MGQETEPGDFVFSNPAADAKGETWINPADYNGPQTPSKFKAVLVSIEPGRADPAIASTETARMTLRKGLQLPDGEYKVTLVVAAVRPEADFAYRDNGESAFTPTNFKDTGRDLQFHRVTLFEKRKIADAPGNYFIEIQDLTGPTYRNIFVDQVIFTKTQP